MPGIKGQRKGIGSTLCSKCKKEKDIPTQRYCRLCKNKYMAQWRKKYPLTAEQRFKSIVRRKTTMRVKRGLLIKYPCEVCGTEDKIEAHHKDYNKPYDVMWLCRSHHREWHKNNDTIT